MIIRRLREEEANPAAEVYLAARALMTYVPRLPAFEADSVKRYFNDILFKTSTVFGADLNGHIIGILALKNGWIEQLYIAPGHTGLGLGVQFINLAKTSFPAGLQLWALEQNTRAIRFYERHEFVTVERTLGERAMEKIPDRRMVWMPG